MKAIILSLVTGLIFLSTNCDRQNSEEQMQITGTIESQGITSYQYGTHTLNTEDEFYALKSEKVSLDEYVGKEVTISGSKIEGYPVDGGPDYILVTEVKE
ncbi:hypothetical protein APR41_00425 [Salegentibacter salinarum]|uniref:DUF3221 domain-containing protein n=1 Tax=Salegentibacter salinarum TaxID=447422 RepID=A0A2N0U3K2_9FLAO|nr:hypothetical protein [Salegentibacter salinarum]PKD21486.1 hypothetical protein APR41_00425 [Salegentibacter salinarum]SKB37829.1 hypothetical protein SAMN05660903_00483 [Salegentibacter salinarum]